MSRFPVQNEVETGIEGELVVFEGQSDEELVYSAGGSPYHLIALYERYKGLIDGLVGERLLSQQVWFDAFELLKRDPQSLLPVEDKLTQLGQKCFGARSRSEGTFLPDPLAWYLRSVVVDLPQPSRLILQLVEVEQRTPEEIAGFFAERQVRMTALEVSQCYGQAQTGLVEGLPTDVRRYYFGGVLDCLSLIPWLHLDMTDEMRDFDAWQQAQTPPKKRPWWLLAPVALSLVVIGAMTQTIPTPPPQSQISVQPPADVPQPQALTRPPSSQSLPWSGRTYLLVADAGPKGFAKLRTIDREIYYRKYQGKPHIQIGVFSTRSSAEATGLKVSRLGFAPILVPKIAP